MRPCATAHSPPLMDRSRGHVPCRPSARRKPRRGSPRRARHNAGALCLLTLALDVVTARAHPRSSSRVLPHLGACTRPTLPPTSVAAPVPGWWWARPPLRGSPRPHRGRRAGARAAIPAPAGCEGRAGRASTRSPTRRPYSAAGDVWAPLSAPSARAAAAARRAAHGVLGPASEAAGPAVQPGAARHRRADHAPPLGPPQVCPPASSSE